MRPNVEVKCMHGYFFQTWLNHNLTEHSMVFKSSMSDANLVLSNLTYMADRDFNGWDRYSIVVNHSGLVTSDYRWIWVEAINDAPVIHPPPTLEYEVNEMEPFT